MDELICMIVGMNGEWMENSWTTPWEMTNTMDLKQKIYEKNMGKRTTRHLWTLWELENPSEISGKSVAHGKSIGNLSGMVNLCM